MGGVGPWIATWKATQSPLFAYDMTRHLLCYAAEDVCVADANLTLTDSSGNGNSRSSVNVESQPPNSTSKDAETPVGQVIRPEDWNHTSYPQRGLRWALGGPVLRPEVGLVTVFTCSSQRPRPRMENAQVAGLKDAFNSLS